MTRIWTICAACLLSLYGASCGTGGAIASKETAQITPLYGTSATAANLYSDKQVVIVDFGKPTSSVFEQLSMPSGFSAMRMTWTGLSTESGKPTALTIALPNQAGYEIGVCKLLDAPPVPISLRIELQAGQRQVSVAPGGPENLITDLKVVDVGSGQVALGWTQVNFGDLDLNGEVNAADLTTIAQHFNASYDPNDPNKRLLPEFWADGDGNGVINAADITVIGQHYQAAVAGYNIRRNGQLIPGAHPGDPTILPDQGTQPQPGLPKRFSVVTPGAGTDTWLVTAVDYVGAEGTNSSGLHASTDIIANLSIGGVPMLDLNGANPGSFGTGKFSSRVIEPIENPYSISQPLAVTGTTSIFTGIQRTKTLFLLFNYLPSVNLTTGQAKGPASVRNASAEDEDLVTTAVPFQLPPGTGTAQIDADIELSPNPSGGYFVELVTTLNVPGQLPTTTHTRLEYASGKLARDANNNSNYEDEIEFLDTDRDCISNALLTSAQDDDEYEIEDRGEGKLVGAVDSVDLDHSTITFSSRTLVGGDVVLPDAPLTLTYDEQTFFDGLSLNNVLHGTETEVEFYLLHDASGVAPDVLRIKSMALKNAHSNGYLEASDNRTGEIRVRWNKVDNFTSFRVERLAPNPAGGYTHEWDKVFGAGETDQYEDLAVTPGIIYEYRYFGLDGQNSTLLGHDTGAELPAGP